MTDEGEPLSVDHAAGRLMSSLPRSVGFTVALHVALLVLLLVAVRYRLNDVRYTAFYDVAGQQMRQEDRATVSEAASTAFMQSLIQLRPTFPASCPPLPPGWVSPPRPLFCLVMVTTPRVRPYLLQALASYVLSHCPPSPARDAPQPCSPMLPLHNLYAGSAPHADFDAIKRAKLPFFPTARGPPGTAAASNRDDSSSWYRTELLDYAAALQYCHSESMGQDEYWTVVLEDDVVVTRGMVEKLRAGMERLKGRDDWLLVRLFRSSYWDGWEAQHWPILTALALAGGFTGAAAAALVLTLRRYHTQRSLQYRHKRDAGDDCLDDDVALLALPRTPDTQPSVDARRSQMTTAAVVGCSCVLSALLTLAALLLLNRQNIPLFAHPRGVHPIGDSAGTQAILFSSHHIPALIAYLHLPSHPSHLPIDVALNDFVHRAGLRQLQLIPHLVEHRGAFSSAAAKNQGEYQYLKVSSHFEDEVDVGGWVKAGWKPALDEESRCLDGNSSRLLMVSPSMSHVT